MLYYFYGYSTKGKSVFVGTNKEKIEQRRKDFLSVHYKNKATNIFPCDDIKIFEMPFPMMNKM